MAQLYNCEFLEISTVLHHLIDDLLVKIVKRIKSNIEQILKGKERLELNYLQSSVRDKKNSRSSSISHFLRKHLNVRTASFSKQKC